MDIEGTYTLQATPEEVWACLMDIQTLQRTIPGIEQLARLGENSYAFTMHIKHAPLRGSYSGNAITTDLEYTLSYYLNVDGEGTPGKFHAEWSITLRALDVNTVIAYQGTLRLTKAGAPLPAQLVKGTIKVLIQQFFTALADYLRTRRYSNLAPFENTPIQLDLPQFYNGRDDALIPQDQPAILYAIVRQLRLGGKDPLLEEQWVIRLRRIGIVSVLLLLVWIGTRLPGKIGEFTHR
jgi:carbon monoxide dehydrogenase subunit G